MKKDGTAEPNKDFVEQFHHPNNPYMLVKVIPEIAAGTQLVFGSTVSLSLTADSVLPKNG